MLDEDAAEPIVKAAVEGGIKFFDTADTYSGGASEVATGRLLPKFLDRDQYVRGDEGIHADGPGRERPAACPASTSCPRSMPRSGG